MAKRKYTKLPFVEKPVAEGNFDSNRVPIDRIVIHTTAGTLASALARFNTPNEQASSNYIIDLDGTLYAMLEEYYVPYTNGNYQMNQRSVTIEHVDSGDYDGLRGDALYDKSSKLVADICKFYSIPCDRSHILKHNEVSATHCPGTLDIERIVREAQELLNPSPEFTDQTRIPKEMLNWTENLEIQQIRGLLGDLKRVTEQAKQCQKRLKETETELAKAQDNYLRLKIDFELYTNSSPSIADISTSQLFWELVKRITGYAKKTN